MAKVLVAFHNGIVDEKNPEAMPVFMRRLFVAWILQEIRSLCIHMECLEQILERSMRT